MEIRVKGYTILIDDDDNPDAGSFSATVDDLVRLL